MASSHLQWLVIKNDSCFLMKSRNCRKAFSKESRNLKNMNLYKYNGLIHKRTVGVTPAADGKGVVLELSKPKVIRRPVKRFYKVTLKKDNRRILKSIYNNMKGRYHYNLNLCAQKRASAILKSQKYNSNQFLKKKIIMT
ncbi:unnamed protein product [Gordionus sp. m RMFG-2023]|uniref:large ribosomal subunit protein eL28-like n=1 Tax=Gordionus sp. m RMFG-2023 TaxID=3053472 RepID=UPI0030DF3CF0